MQPDDQRLFIGDLDARPQIRRRNRARFGRPRSEDPTTFCIPAIVADR